MNWIDKRICPHVWRRRKRVYSWTRQRNIRGCSKCRREWTRWQHGKA